MLKAYLISLAIAFVPGVVSFFFARSLYSKVEAAYFLRTWGFALLWGGTAIFVGMLGGSLLRTMSGNSNPVSLTVLACVMGFSWLIGMRASLALVTPAMMETWEAHNIRRLAAG